MSKREHDRMVRWMTAGLLLAILLGLALPALVSGG